LTARLPEINLRWMSAQAALDIAINSPAAAINEQIEKDGR
jgi:hypothetical protein